MQNVNTGNDKRKGIREPLLMNGYEEQEEVEVFEVKCNPNLNFAYKKSDINRSIPMQKSSSPAVTPKTSPGPVKKVELEKPKKAEKREFYENTMCLNILGGVLFLMTILTIIMFCRLSSLDTFLNQKP